MYLKSLAIQGFKSFPDRTTINFSGGIIAIVGPNGSGKSNIVDAIRWVLGEQSSKTLRGAKMEDVIFNGTSSRKPTGFAEVTLCIDNGDGAMPIEMAEVSVTRRLYRSGESEYFIGGKPARLRDIVELFMNTGIGRDGYSVIGQGKISDVLSAKGDERRVIFEEAAGISKFRYRKGEAEKKLAVTEDNLLRVHDILNELESRVGPLKAQSEKARAYLTLSEEKKRLEINVWLDGIDKTVETRAAVGEKYAIAKAELDEACAAYEAEQAELDELTRLSQEKNSQIDELRRSARQAEEGKSEFVRGRATAEADIRHALENIERIKQSIEAGNMRFADFDEQRAAAEQIKNEICQKIKGLEKELEAIAEQTERILKEQSGAADSLEKASAELALLTGGLTDSRISLSALLSRADSYAQKLSELSEAEKEISGRLLQVKEQLKQAKEEYEALEESIRGNENIIAGYKKKLEARKVRLNELAAKERTAENALLEKRHRAGLLSDMEKHYEGFAESVKAVMQEAARGRLKNIYGPVSGLIKVPEEYSVAVETALGGAIQNIVLETEEDAKAAIMLLKSEKKGRATFLPVASVKGSQLDERGLKGENGYIGLAFSLAEFDKRFEGIFTSLLGRTAVVENIDCAIAMARKNGYRFRIVTLDGQIINAGGSFTGGSQIRGSGVLSRRNEIEALNAEADKLEQQLKELAKETDGLRAEISKAEAGLDGASAENNVAHERLLKAEGIINQQKSLEEALTFERERLARHRDETREKAETDEKERAVTAEIIREFEEKIAHKEEQLEKLSSGQSDAAKLKESLAEKLAEKKLAVVALEKDAAAQDERIARIEAERELQKARIEERLAETALNETEIENKKAEIAKIDLKERELISSIDSLLEKVKTAERERNEADRMAAELRKKSKDTVTSRENLIKEVERCEAKKAAVENEYDLTIAKMWDEYELTLSECQSLREDIGSISAASRRINEIKGRIKSLGSVNVSAIEEYKEVKERYDFLTGQVEDLENAKASLEGLIDDLTQEMKKIFSGQFLIIQANFSKVFAELFGGGKASLELSDPGDVLNSGIEIMVSPPGKIIKHLSALSGGEQALTAISLYFAIMLVRPAPFCILDEIDAPLDEVNVARLSAYMRKMTGKSQFICITHKRLTMEGADMLYGVTMQESGVTKLLSINVAEAEKRLGKTTA